MEHVRYLWGKILILTVINFYRASVLNALLGFILVRKVSVSLLVLSVMTMTRQMGNVYPAILGLRCKMGDVWKMMRCWMT